MPTPDPANASLPVGFRDVDAAPLDTIVRCLDTLQAMPATRAYKAGALELLGLTPASAVLDVACGLGDDVVRLKAHAGRAVGLDRSEVLIAAARARHADAGCEFVTGDAAALPFPDNTFDAVRIDRSLQHVEDPARVVREMARVARPGGVVLCAEPDWGTFLLFGPRTPVAGRVERDWVGTFRNPWVGRELPGLLAAAGVTGRHLEGHWLPTRGFAETDVVFQVGATARKLAAGVPEAPAWLDAYRSGEAMAGVLIVICCGRKG